jgi:hypothetical protein
MSEIDYLREPLSITGFKNVKYHKQWKRYETFYWVGKRRIYVGSFLTAEEAAWAQHNATKDIKIDPQQNSYRLGREKDVKKPRRKHAQDYLEELTRISHAQY